MADVVVFAVGGIEQLTVVAECFELGLQRGKLFDPCTDVSELGVDERNHVRAGQVPVVAKGDDGVSCVRDRVAFRGLNQTTLWGSG